MIFRPISLLSHHHIDSFLSHRSLYNVLPQCDKHGNRPSFLRKLYALDSSIKKTRPQFARVYLRWHLAEFTKLSVSGWQRHARAPPPSLTLFRTVCSVMGLPKCVVLLGFCKVPISKVSYTSVTVLLTSRHTTFLPCEVSSGYIELPDKPLNCFVVPVKNSSDL